MKYLILLAIGISLSAKAFSRQQPIPLVDLIELVKLGKVKIAQFAKSKGFSYERYEILPNDLIREGGFMDTVWHGEHTAPAPSEDDPPINRTIHYCDHYRRFGDSKEYVDLRYTTTDFAEYDGMIEWLAAHPEYILDPGSGKYTDGKFAFAVEDARIKINRMGTGNFIRRYRFRALIRRDYIEGKF
jgi:hypothetical protein